METTKIISPYFENGIFAGVRVCVGDEDFVIFPKDFRFGKEMTWQEAMDALKADGLSTFNYCQICHTMAYHKEVGKILKCNGGDALDSCYWTCTESSAYHSFYYYGYKYLLSYSNKANTYSVRPIKNLKNS